MLLPTLSRSAPARPLRRSRPAGFSLLELMVVVAIIVILALIALPGIPDKVIRDQIVEGMKLTEIAKDIRTTNLPIGPVGQSVELHQVTTAVIFNYTPYPNAAKAYLQFMFEEPQMNAWITSSAGYCCQTLKAYASNPVWTADPNNAPYAKASETLRPNGYAGPLGYASAQVMADYILVDMFAECATGQRSPEEAAKRAETRANRYYRV